MAKWFFLFDAEGWSVVGGFEWTAAEGLGLGCLYTPGAGDYGVNTATTSISGQSISVNPGDPMSFWVKIIQWDGGGLNTGTWTITLKVVDGITVLAEAIDTFSPDGITQFTTNGLFVKVTGVATDSGTADFIELKISASNEDIIGLFYVDNIYVAESDPLPIVTNARFYFAPTGQPLTEKFTLPFPGVRPGGMTLNRTLGTVVIGSDAPSNEPVVYSAYPYLTGTATYDGFPTGSSIQSLKWI